MFTFLPRFLFVIFCLFLLCLSSVYAQRLYVKPPVIEEPDTSNVWVFGGTGSFNLNQISLSNWAAGGQNSLSILAAASLYGNYKKGKGTWNNTLDMTYGLVKIEGRRMQKSDDRVELNLKYGYRASKEWYYTGQFNARTQLTPTYSITRDTLVSNLFSPMYILTSLGMDFKPSDKLSIFLSPLTGKFTIVESQMLADRGAFGVERAEKDAEGNRIPGTGKHLRKEFGGYVNVRYKNEILDNVLLQSKLDLFSNYLKDPENIDVNFENQLTFKFNELVTANLFFHMIYDDDVRVDVDRDGDGKDESKGPRLQVKQMLGVGLSYTFD